MTRDLTALAWITADLVRRLLREPQVVRSLLWPIGLVPITLMLTMFAFVWLEGDWPVAVSESVPSSTREALVTAGFTVVEVPDVRAAVVAGEYRSGTDGQTLYAGALRGRTQQVERVLRSAQPSSWTFATPAPVKADFSHGGRIVRVTGVLFALFGIVFGAGMVARDRDDGTLEAELGLGIRRWVHGSARLIAGAGILAVHYALAMAVMNAILGVTEPGQVLRHGVAASLGSVAIGLIVIGRGGLKTGFSGPLATGLTAGTGLAALGALLPGLGMHLPIASLLTGGPGWTPFLASMALGVVSVVSFLFRSARA